MVKGIIHREPTVPVDCTRFGRWAGIWRIVILSNRFSLNCGATWKRLNGGVVMGLSRTACGLVVGLGLTLLASLAEAASVQVAQNAPPPALPPAVIQSITQAGDPAALQAAVKAAVAANPNLAIDIVTVAVGQRPADAAAIAAAAASADPTDAAAIVVAAIAALPPGQQQNDAPAIVAAVELAVPGSTDQVTTAITALAFNPAPVGTRGNEGAPLVAPHTDPRLSPN